MEAITILRELWRLRYLVFLGAILALAIALMTAYRISLAPPKLESRQYHVGVASARVLVDTPDSQVVDLNPKGADALSSRASLLANLMASSPVKTIIARDAGRAGQPARGRRAFRDRSRPRPRRCRRRRRRAPAPRRPTS